MTRKMNESIQFFLPPALAEAAKVAAERRIQSVSALMRGALIDHLTKSGEWPRQESERAQCGHIGRDGFSR
jgi:hypothetical protein